MATGKEFNSEIVKFLHSESQAYVPHWKRKARSVVACFHKRIAAANANQKQRPSTWEEAVKNATILIDVQLSKLRTSEWMKRCENAAKQLRRKHDDDQSGRMSHRRLS